MEKNALHPFSNCQLEPKSFIVANCDLKLFSGDRNCPNTAESGGFKVLKFTHLSALSHVPHEFFLQSWAIFGISYLVRESMG